MQYFLMHEDKKLALFELDNLNNVVNVALSTNADTRRYLPMTVFDNKSLVFWLKNRVIK